MNQQDDTYPDDFPEAYDAVVVLPIRDLNQGTNREGTRFEEAPLSQATHVGIYFRFSGSNEVVPHVDFSIENKQAANVAAWAISSEYGLACYNKTR